MEKITSVTVIIPTYRDHNSLVKCVEALENQSINIPFKIVIVDNDGSKEQLPCIDGNNITIIKETKKGSYAARNTGIKVAKSDIIGFTDADCVPDRDWLKNAIKHFNKGSNIVAGFTRITISENPSLIEIYEFCLAFDFNYYKRLNRAPTANLLIKSDVISSVGKFDESSQSTGDMEWCRRANMYNYDINFCSDVIVEHPARLCWNEILKKTRRVTLGNLDHGFMTRKVSVLEFLKVLFPTRHSITLLFDVKFSLTYRLKAFFVDYILKHYAFLVRLRYKA